MPNVLGPIARIDQGQAVVRLDQLRSTRDQSEKAFAETIEEGATNRAVGAAAKIMDTHGRANGGVSIDVPMAVAHGSPGEVPDCRGARGISSCSQ